MALADRPDGTMPPTPMQVVTEDGTMVYPLADRFQRINVMPQSPETVDHQGHVVWSDDFEDNVNHWEQAVEGEATTVALSTDSAHRGAKALKVVTDAAAEDGASLTKYFPEVAQGLVGLELRFALPEGGLNAGVFVELRDGSKVYTFGFRYYEHDLYELEGWDGLTDTWKPGVATVLRSAPSAYNVLKLVLDLTNHTYLRAICNGVSYDLSQWTCSQSVDTDPEGLMVTLGMYATGDAAQTGYFDDFILTDGEPTNARDAYRGRFGPKEYDPFPVSGGG